MIIIDEAVCFWVAERTGGEYIIGTGQGIGLVRNEQIVVGASFYNFNGRSVHASFAVEGKNFLNREFIWVFSDYVFRQLNVNKLIGVVDSCNADAIKFNLHFGFKHEATLTDAGSIGDLLLFTMTKDQCRFLTRGKRNGKIKQSATST